MSKRPTITPALKVAALLHRVFQQFGVYLKCPISGEDMTPEDRIQFDHIHCVELGGPNVYDNLRPVLVAPHQKKTKADLRMIKKARPKHADKFVVEKPALDLSTFDRALRSAAKFVGKGKRKMRSRGFPEKPEGYRHNWRKA